MIIAILNWAWRVPALIFLDLFTWIFSPILCLFVTKAEESSITGHPSLIPGKPREFLIKPLRLFQSPDAPLDEWWFAGYEKDSWLKRTFNQYDYETRWWLRYVCRILWLCRNPAYGFGDRLGYSASGMRFLVSQDQDYLWKSGLPNRSFWKVVNDKGQIGWCYQAQIYFYKQRCLEIYIGYKLLHKSATGRQMVAMRFNPFRQYVPKTAS